MKNFLKNLEIRSISMRFVVVGLVFTYNFK